MNRVGVLGLAALLAVGCGGVDLRITLQRAPGDMVEETVESYPIRVCVRPEESTPPIVDPVGPVMQPIGMPTPGSDGLEGLVCSDGGAVGAGNQTSDVVVIPTREGRHIVILYR